MTEWQERFEAVGVQVAAMTYDGVDKLAAFQEKHGVGYPVLSDQGAAHVNALGIRNEEYGEGPRRLWRCPPPASSSLTRRGIIRLKRALPGYRDRPPFDELLGAVTAAVGTAQGDEDES